MTRKVTNDWILWLRCNCATQLSSSICFCYYWKNREYITSKLTIKESEPVFTVTVNSSNPRVVLLSSHGFFLRGSARVHACTHTLTHNRVVLTKNSILDFSTTAGVPGGAMGGALGGIVRQNWTFHFSCVAWSGNCFWNHDKVIWTFKITL